MKDSAGACRVSVPFVLLVSRPASQGHAAIEPLREMRKWADTDISCHGAENPSSRWGVIGGSPGRLEVERGAKAVEERTGSLVKDSGWGAEKSEGRATHLLGNAKYMGPSI